DVDYAEDCRMRADDQPLREDGYQCEAGILDQHSRAIAQVLNQCLHNSPTEIRPQSYTKKHEDHFPLFVNLRVALWRKFIHTGARPSDPPSSPFSPERARLVTRWRRATA